MTLWETPLGPLISTDEAPGACENDSKLRLQHEQTRAGLAQDSEVCGIELGVEALPCYHSRHSSNKTDRDALNPPLQCLSDPASLRPCVPTKGRKHSMCLNGGATWTRQRSRRHQGGQSCGRGHDQQRRVRQDRHQGEGGPEASPRWGSPD